MKFAHWLFAVALFTASCDTILVLNVGGTLHLEQVVMILILLLAVGRMIQTNTIVWPRGGMGLALWVILQGLFLGQSAVPLSVDLQLYVLLLFTLGGIFTVLQLYGTSSWVPRLMKVYLSSFVFVAAFGLFQFVTPALHLGTWLVGMWIVHGLIPRIQGFNYEPSYFATYLIMGWIMLIDLQVTKARITAKRRWLWFTVLVTVVFFLCTSKTAWIFMILEAVLRLVPAVYNFCLRQARRLLAGDLHLPLPRPKILAGLVTGVVLFVAFLSGVSRIVDLNVFLQGSGLNNTAAHSIDDRSASLVNTFKVFKEHPWVGLGMTGVTARKAEIEGGVVNNLMDFKLHWAFPAPLEVLAGSGLIGIIPFLWFFLSISVGETQLMKRNWDDDRARWLHALIRAMAFEWLCLMADQNLLRVYVWFHVTMVVVVGYNLRYVQAGEQPAEALVPA